MLSRIKDLQPKKKLKIYSIILCILSSILFILTMTSLSIMGSNLMVTDELSTSSELDVFQQQHSSYIISQRMIVAFDVLCVIGLPLLMFSVFKFYTKGNLIIIIINSILQAIRWISAIVFVAGESQLRENWNKLLQTSDYGLNPLCKLQTCGQSLLNYVICGKLLLWKQSYNFEFGMIIIGIPLITVIMMLSYITNNLDLKLVQFSQSTD